MVRSSDKECLKLYNILLELYAEIAEVADINHNLAAIFFNDLVQVLTSVLLSNTDLRTNHKLYFACFKPSVLQKLSIKQKILNTMPFFFRNTKRVGFSGVSLHNSFFLAELLKNKISPVFIDRGIISIDNFDEQFEKILLAIRYICDEFSFSVPSAKLEEYFKSVFVGYLAAKKNNKLEIDLLITGTQQNTLSRVIAANARSHKIPVVCISHGDGDQLTTDEPRIGYGELTYATHFFGYGKWGETLLKKTEYAKSLGDNQPMYCAANSDTCYKIYKPEGRVKKLSEFDSPEYMYVPTKFVGEKQYGPFHVPSDQEYLKWQRLMLKMYPNVIYKRHPKNFANYSEFEFKRCITDNFAQCLDMADVFIFDVISTAFQIAAATDKPIIFFDIGIRNIHADVKKRIMKRCIWIEALTCRDSHVLFSSVEKQANEQKINEYTKDICLDGSSNSRKTALLSLIQKVLQKTINEEAL